MSKDWYADIVEFHKEVMEDNFPTTPYLPDLKHRQLRQALIKEEMEETLDAIGFGNDLVEIADGICDSIVVLLGTAVTCGIDIRPIWDEVHRTNMLKKEGRMREDGKRLKPPGWKPPEVERLIREQMGCVHLELPNCENIGHCSNTEGCLEAGM